MNLKSLYGEVIDILSRKSVNSINDTDTVIAISGIVIDGNDSLAVPGASISIKNELSSVLTDADGRFKIQFKGNADQKVILVSKSLGYETTEIEIDLAHAQSLEVKLKIVPSVLGELTVVAGGINVRRPFINRVGHFFKRVLTGRY